MIYLLQDADLKILTVVSGVQNVFKSLSPLRIPLEENPSMVDLKLAHGNLVTLVATKKGPRIINMLHLLLNENTF